MKPIIECVPNISEGRDQAVIQAVAGAAEAVDGVTLLDVDPGRATNRTVITFAGDPKAVVEGAFRLISKASELIDMRHHSGEHPRFGATDVCPFVPVAHATMDDCIDCARRLGERVGSALNIPVYLYENAASRPERRNLAMVRAGEYEGIADRITAPEWAPDFGPATFNPSAGNIAIGARDFLIAYNVNLNTTSVARANSVAFDVREKGRIKTEDGTPNGTKVLDANGDPVREPGMCTGVKAIGWYIEEYGMAQISMNITDVRATPLHEAFDACVESAHRRGLRVTGSELVGLVPLDSMLDAGRYFLRKQGRSAGVSEAELVRIAVKSLGLDDLKPFDPRHSIIEYRLRSDEDRPLIHTDLADFAHETASDSPAPGGGSISAYVGSLGAALGTMVANLSAHKYRWEDIWTEFSAWAERGQDIKDRLLQLVDEDTHAFNRILDAVRMPKGSDAERTARSEAMTAATKNAIDVPLRIMRTAVEAFDLLEAMAKDGNPNSISDAGVGALCARTAVRGAYLNVLINMDGLEDDEYVRSTRDEAERLLSDAERREAAVLDLVHAAIR